MKELEELIAWAEENLALAQSQKDEANIRFYSQALETYRGETGLFWARMLLKMRGIHEP